jgi:hypothetical protein
MERFFVCKNGHSFRIESDEEPTGNEADVYLKVLCPHCAEPYEIRWPSGIAFHVVAE